MRIRGRMVWTPGATVMVVCALSISGLAAAGSVGTIKIKGNHPTEFARLGPVVHADPAMELHLSVVLGVHDQAKLEELIADQQNPSSSQYHQWLTPKQFNERFGPTQAQT